MGTGKTVEYIDLNHKRLRGRPVIEYLLYYPVTERHVLWVVSNCKEAYNTLYYTQFLKSKTAEEINNSRIGEAGQVLQDLKARGYVRQDEDRNWHLTFYGWFYRFYIHPGTVVWLAVIAIVVSFLQPNLNCNGAKNTKEPESKPLKQATTDSVANAPQSVPDSLGVKKYSAKRKDSLR